MSNFFTVRPEEKTKSLLHTTLTELGVVFNDIVDADFDETQYTLGDVQTNIFFDKTGKYIRHSTLFVGEPTRGNPNEEVAP